MIANPTAAFVAGLILGGLGAWLLLRAYAIREARRAAQLERELADLRQSHADATVQLAELRAEANHDKLRWIERAEQTLREAFQALAAEALRMNTDSLLGRVTDQLQRVLADARGDWQTGREHLARLVEPLGRALEGLEREIRLL